MPRSGVMTAVSAVPKEWVLTKEGFDRFLGSLDSDREKAGRIYETLHAKLISFFDWRNCPFPEEHADEVINRLIKKLDNGNEIRDPSTYIFGIARMFLHEIERNTEKQRVALSQVQSHYEIEIESEEVALRANCLNECLASLSERNRELIVQYYDGDGSLKIRRRKELALRLGLQLNALRIRACRLREKLEECMGRCLVKNI